MGTTSGSNRLVLSLAALCLLLFLTACPAATGGEHAARVTVRASGADGQPSGDEKPKRPSQQRAVTAAVYLLVGIAFAGLAMVALIALLGHHVRRFVRKPQPRQTPLDELWYLRPKKEIAKEQEAELPRSDENDEGIETP